MYRLCLLSKFLENMYRLCLSSAWIIKCLPSGKQNVTSINTSITALISLLHEFLFLSPYKSHFTLLFLYKYANNCAIRGNMDPHNKLNKTFFITSKVSRFWYFTIIMYEVNMEETLCTISVISCKSIIAWNKSFLKRNMFYGKN